MNRYAFRLLALLLITCCSTILSNRVTAAETVRVYPAPAGEPLSARFTVKVEDSHAPVYLARVVALTPEQREKVRGAVDLADTSEAAFTSFDIGRSVRILVACTQPIQSAKVLPTSSGITPVIAGNQVTFTIAKPSQLTLEVNGDWLNSLHLFANPPETDAPSPDDPNVIYFGPGVHETQSIKVDSGKTVYIAGGAVVYGKIGPTSHGAALFGWSGSNITLRGRGIIDGSRMPRGSGGLLWAQGSNIKMEGVVLRDSSGWTMPIEKADQVKVQNVKIFGWRGNSDGIDICNSRNVDVSDCFLRTFDDLVVVKSNDPQGGPSRDITVKNCMLWNEFAHALSLGAELRTPVENVRFSDCDIIHDKGREWDLRVYNCDSAAVKNIVFDNIRIEESRRLFSLWIGKAIWSKEAQRGHIDDIVFRNITSVAPGRSGPIAALVGVDDDHAIHHVEFDHVLVGGRALGSADLTENQFVKQVSVTP
jgi:hypothetical protein